MLNERVKELLDYLNVLSQIQASGHYVNEEIKEAVKELRIELGLEKKKEKTLKESRRLVFEARLGGKASFIQHCVFEAVFGSYEGIAEISFFASESFDVKLAVDVLKEMKAPAKFTFGSGVLKAEKRK
jgi:hypothetical protein